ncbi:hypothetical protein SCHPADRAFT_487395 [Schizopora paradoxa]|uniref:MYND-type domain-containing protein n=1 Tax=Schizopora paradoxa TaxID=27342 RepID=A0A0H2RGZ6_9AGAM|nr:hypothetical protein SCHPADRAFT_487395 [Schizopora paradoxa]
MPAIPGSNTNTQCAEDNRKEIRRTLRAFRAKPPRKPSDLQAFIDLCNQGVPSGLITDIVSCYCKQLDAPTPAFDLSKPAALNSSSLASPERRQFAFIALDGLGTLGASSSSHFKLEALPTIRLNWPKLLNWIRYFCREATEALATIDVSRSILVLTMLLSLIIGEDAELFEKTLIEEQDFFEIILKIWWVSYKHSDTITLAVSRAAFIPVSLSVIHLRSKQPLNEAIQEIILRAADDDALGVAGHILGYLTGPASSACVRHALLLIHNISTDVEPSKLKEALFQKQAALHVMHLLESILLDASSCEPTYSKSMGSSLIDTCVYIIRSSVMDFGALHWNTVLLEHGLLRCVANLVESPYVTEDVEQDLLPTYFLAFIPQLFAHRGFVLSTIKAVKEAAKDGSAARIESSFFGDTYQKFLRIVLERAVFNAILERSSSDYAVFEQRRCYNCGRIEESLETGLNKCKGCLVALYCSRDCQKEAWKEGHKRECKSLKDTSRHE